MAAVLSVVLWVPVMAMGRQGDLNTCRYRGSIKAMIYSANGQGAN